MCNLVNSQKTLKITSLQINVILQQMELFAEEFFFWDITPCCLIKLVDVSWEQFPPFMGQKVIQVRGQHEAVSTALMLGLLFWAAYFRSLFTSYEIKYRCI